jgi:hypothetical protein
MITPSYLAADWNLIAAHLVPSSSYNTHVLLRPQTLSWQSDQLLFRGYVHRDRLSLQNIFNYTTVEKVVLVSTRLRGANTIELLPFALE